MWKKWLWRGVAVLASVALALVGLGWWLWSCLALEDGPRAVDPDWPALVEADPPRGRILAVVSSWAKQPHNGRTAGYELTELSRAYALFLAHGYAVDIASPQGGKAPMKLDDSLTSADRAFLADAQATARREATLRLDQIDPARYAAVYFVGGKGTLYDFADNPEIARIGAAVWAQGGVLAAVCHGPAALLGIRRADGRPLLAGRRVAGFSNAEETFLLPEAAQVLPFLLQDRLVAAGAHYVEGPRYLDQVATDGRLVTGQNPWSTWSTAEATLRALGVTPAARIPTAEEHSVRVLRALHDEGTEAAWRVRGERPADRHLLAMHALIAAMEWRLADAWRLHALARPHAVDHGR